MFCYCCKGRERDVNHQSPNLVKFYSVVRGPLLRGQNDKYILNGYVIDCEAFEYNLKTFQVKENDEFDLFSISKNQSG